MAGLNLELLDPLLTPTGDASAAARRSRPPPPGWSAPDGSSAGGSGRPARPGPRPGINGPSGAPPAGTPRTARSPRSPAPRPEPQATARYRCSVMVNSTSTRRSVTPACGTPWRRIGRQIGCTTTPAAVTASRRCRRPTAGHPSESRFRGTSAGRSEPVSGAARSSLREQVSGTAPAGWTSVMVRAGWEEMSGPRAARVVVELG